MTATPAQAPEDLPFVPVDADPERGTVDFMDLRGGDFTLPFLQDTVAGVAGELDRMRLTMKLELARQMVPPKQRGAPPLLIFHSGRCGSTVLSGILGAVMGVPVAKEPDVLTSLVAAQVARDHPAVDVVAEMVRMVSHSVGAADHTCRANHAIVKFTAWLTGQAERLLETLPGTPALFVFRHPVPTVASMLHAPPAWLQHFWPDNAFLAEPYFPGEPGLQTAEHIVDFLALIWSSIVASALRVRPELLMFVEYRSLVTDPVGTLESIGRHVNSECPAGVLEDAVGALRIYAKEPGSRPYDPAGADRRAPLPTADAELVKSLTADLYAAANSRAQRDRIRPRQPRQPQAAHDWPGWDHEVAGTPLIKGCPCPDCRSLALKDWPRWS